ncbi:hypothetical protein GCM10011571_08030 [Marinithermofilum abyssi]|uniref:Uncharacterized protein n=1 Tax=Marinithermofilum abyssi TaxID=1571185 RepID=A0A8J2VHM5_9BACL|nr:hypothetical protein GCM10011571_08030 [Marinithermofilum abyssi]
MVSSMYDPHRTYSGNGKNFWEIFGLLGGRCRSESSGGTAYWDWLRWFTNYCNPLPVAKKPGKH